MVDDRVHRGALAGAGAARQRQNFQTNFENFLLLVLYFFIPWTAVNLVDYFIVRHGHYAIGEIFNPHGIYGRWGWRGILSYLVGFAAMLPFFSIGTFFTGWVANAATAATSRCSSGCRSPGSSTGCWAATSTSRPRPGSPRSRPTELEDEAAEHERPTRRPTVAERPGRRLAAAAESSAPDGRRRSRWWSSAPSGSYAGAGAQRLHGRAARAGAGRRRAALTNGYAPADRAAAPGVPVSVKDHIWLAGVRATNGSRALRDFVPDRGRRCVARLQGCRRDRRRQDQQPGVLLPRLHRQRRLRADPQPVGAGPHSRGSTGGAGASVAAGRRRSALGTDGGGSIRIPAAFCGVVGHKPTFGLVPKMPGFRGWPTLSVDGPLTRTVRDAALASRVMAGASAGDDLSWPLTSAAWSMPSTRRVDWSRLRVAVSEDLGWAPVEPSVRAAFRRRGRRARRRRRPGRRGGPGHAVPDGAVERRSPCPRASPPRARCSRSGAAGWRPGPPRSSRPGGRHGAADYLDAQDAAGRDYTRRWGDFFDDYDVLLTPSMPLPAFGTDVASPRRSTASRSTRSSTTGARWRCPPTSPASRRARCRPVSTTASRSGCR